LYWVATARLQNIDIVVETSERIQLSQIFFLPLQGNVPHKLLVALDLELAKYRLEQPKLLVPPFRWNEVRRQDKRPPKASFERPLPVQRFDLIGSLAIEGGVPLGLRFRYSVFPRRIYSATFQLECNQAASSRSMHVLYRMEWRPLSGHVNGKHSDPEVSFRTFEEGETHHHSCLDHVGADGQIKPGDVHLARPITPDLPDLNSALRYACATLNITNGSVLPEPGNQGQLL
jgi:hypothetical protein